MSNCAFCCLASVVLLCGINSFIRDFMLAAHQQAMTDGDYVFIGVRDTCVYLYCKP